MEAGTRDGHPDAAPRAGDTGSEGPAGRGHVSWPRVGGMAAVAAPLLMWAECIGHGLARSGYDLLTRAASDLGARGAPDAAPFTVGFFYGPGLLTGLLGVGLWRAVRGGWAWRTGALLVVAEGLLLVLAGAFPEDATSARATSLHQDLANACFTAAVLAPLALVWGAPAAAFGPPRRLWLLSGAVLALLQVTGAVVGASVPPGLVQRPFGLVLTVWFLSTGAWLLRLPNPAPPGGHAGRAP